MSVNLSIKGVPDDVAARLRARAERNHRSLQGELMAIVEHATQEPHAGTAGSPLSSMVLRRGTTFIRRGTKTIEQIAAEHRLLYPEPIAGLPLAVDITRKDRNSR